MLFLLPGYLRSVAAILASIWIPLVFGTPGPATPPSPPTLPTLELQILQVEHSAIASNAETGTLTVTVAGTGTVDVVRSELSGNSITMTVTLKSGGQVLASGGAGMTSPTGVTVNAQGNTLAWAGYNIRYLPCTSGLPTMRLAHENGYTFTVTNPSPESMWVTFTYDEGLTFQPWVEVPAGTSYAFARQPAAARAYVSHYSGLGPSLVCGNAGWKPM